MGDVVPGQPFVCICCRSASIIEVVNVVVIPIIVIIALTAVC